MYGLTRGMFTLLGAAAAGLLLWLATQLDVDTNGDYWARVGLLAAAGFAVALSQLLGGWTKWGWPRVSVNVLLIGFVPALIAGGWLLLARQPDSNTWQTRADDWAGDLGLGGVLDDLTAVLPAVAFGLGLLLGLVFDTTGPRRAVAVDRHELTHEETRVADEPVAAEREEAIRHEEYHEPDRRVAEALAGRDERRIEIRERGARAEARPTERTNDEDR